MATYFIFEASDAAQIEQICVDQIVEEMKNPQPFLSIVVPRLIDGGPYRDRLAIDADLKGEASLQYLLDRLEKYEVVEMDPALAWPDQAVIRGQITEQQANDAKIATKEPTPDIKEGEVIP